MATPEHDYYEILEINRGATDTDIKEAYRHLALKFHPSKESGHYETFRLLGEAYDVLSDLRKKATYDQFGVYGLKNGVPVEFAKGGAWSARYTYHDNPEKTFKEFFGNENPFSLFYITDLPLQFGNITPWDRKFKDGPIERSIYLSLDDYFHGCTKEIKITHRVLNYDDCTTQLKDKILTVTVKPGTKVGTKVTFPEEGDQGPNNIPADMVFTLHQNPHPQFTRVEDNLLYHTSVSLEKALNGFSVEVATLNGRLLNIPVNDIVHPSYRKVVPGEGMPLLNKLSRRGDLILTFDIRFPQKLSAKRKHLIKQALRS